MSDIALEMHFTQAGPVADLALAGGDLLMDAGLETAILISLFSNRRAAADDPKLTPGQSLEGWWGDMHPQVDGDKMGSRLWLLRRQKNTPDIPALAVEYCTEALQWMVDDGVVAANGLTVTADFASTGGVVPDTVLISITLTAPDGSQLPGFKYYYQWAAQRLLLLNQQ